MRRTIAAAIMVVAILVIAVAVLIMMQGSHPKTDTTKDSDQDGIPDSAERVLGTNPYLADTDGDGINDSADTHPTRYDGQIDIPTGPVGFEIPLLLVENNYDPTTKKDMGDHLEVWLLSLVGTDIGNMSVYYTVLDNRTGQFESYLVNLTGYVLKAHANQTIHFDNGNGYGHFSENRNGIYRTSKDELTFTVTVNAPGYMIQTRSVVKSAGGSETPD
jgi:hypothetical protein